MHMHMSCVALFDPNKHCMSFLLEEEKQCQQDGQAEEAEEEQIGNLHQRLLSQL